MSVNGFVIFVMFIRERFIENMSVKVCLAFILPILVVICFVINGGGRYIVDDHVVDTGFIHKDDE